MVSDVASFVRHVGLDSRRSMAFWEGVARRRRPAPSTDLHRFREGPLFEWPGLGGNEPNPT